MRHVFVILSLGVLWGQSADPEWRLRLNRAIGLLDAGSPEATEAFQTAAVSAGSVHDGGFAKAIVSTHASLLLIRQERYREAEQILLASLAVFDRNPERLVVENVAALNNMAFLLRQTGKLDRELEYLTLAVQKAEAIQPPSPFILVPILGNLAMRHVESGEFDLARAVIEKAAPYEADPTVAAHRFRIPLLNAASEVYLQRGEPKMARDKAALAVRIVERAQGGDAFELNGPLHQLARAEMDSGQFSAANRYWMRSLELLRKHRSKDYPQIASVLVPLATLARIQGRLEECEDMLREAARIAEISHRTAVLAVVQHLRAKLHADRNRHAQAERLYRSSLALTKDSVGTRNMEYTVCLSDFADSLVAVRKYKEAELVLREAIRAKEEIGGVARLSLLSLLERHAELLEKLRRKEEAKTVQARIETLRSARPHSAQEQTIDILELKPRR